MAIVSTACLSTPEERAIDSAPSAPCAAVGVGSLSGGGARDGTRVTSHSSQKERKACSSHMALCPDPSPLPVPLLGPIE